MRRYVGSPSWRSDKLSLKLVLPCSIMHSLLMRSMRYAYAEYLIY